MAALDTVIQVNDISKQYRLGKIGTGTIAHDLNRWWHTIRGKENPYLKLGDVNDRTLKTDSDYVWALRNVSFEVNRGDVVGIIGRNGAGKSTLLKILSRTTTPTLGNIKIKGRVASLLEVGTGFNPELSGKENIFLNGAILGMTKREIKSKFDEIVDFSGVEKYVDTPVKRYSSGMYVRLAFAVAAHLDPEILIVDEVLAVGDAEFQKKAIGKMKDVSKSEGRTVLFVSHNMGAIASLCKKAISLRNGVVHLDGDVDDVLKGFNEEMMQKKSKTVEINKENKKAWLKSFGIQQEGTTNECVETLMDCVFKVIVESTEKLSDIYVGIGINDYSSQRLVTLFNKFTAETLHLEKGEN
ncbi:MAG: ABC transporter ATP-binding protein, partial [Bacteroidetes bacterium]